MHGKGKINFKNGVIFVGDMFKDKKVKGKMSYSNGSIFEGDWFED